MSPQDLAYYFDRYAQGQLTASERQEFAALLRDPANKETVREILDRDWPLWEKASLDFPEELARIEAGVAAAIAAGHEQSHENEQSDVPVHRVRFLRTARWWAAAAVFGAISVWSVFYFTKPEPAIVKKPEYKAKDIQPGGNKAVLTLADGRTIILDSAANGTLAKQGGASIVKLSNGQIVYKAKGSSDEKLLNTMRTPLGGQYQLDLPDGTKVWLNALSSITYPAQFAGRRRDVKITGEVYFEVAKDKARPFVVDVNGQSTIEVLGTDFNINAYGDEGQLKTTLIEGSVKVNSTTIKPGQQATQTGSAISVINDADIDQVLAWKNGLFNFERVNIRQVMLQLERWYDIEVKYEGHAPDFRLRGGMDRNVKLSSILGLLKDLGVQATLDGRTLTIHGD